MCPCIKVLKQKGMLQNKNVLIGIFFSTCFFINGFSQKLAKVYNLESFIIKNKSCTFGASDFSLVFKFKTRNKLYFLDNSDKELVDIKTMGYSLKNDSLFLGWGDSHFFRGHKLYQFCYEDYKRALNSEYKIVFKEDSVILENNLYRFVLRKRDKDPAKTNF